MSKFDEIVGQIKAERDYQVSRWGTEADLKVNTPMDFVGYIAAYATRWFGGGFRPYAKETLVSFRLHMIKVATLALAAIEHVDAILDGEVSRPDVLLDEETA